MFNIGGGEVLVILLVALLVLGPDKLPEAARTAGKVMRQVRDVSSGFQQEVRQAMADVTDDQGDPSVPDVHAGAGAGPSLPAARPVPAPDPANPVPAASDRPDEAAPLPTPGPEAGTWHSDGPSSSFS